MLQSGGRSLGAGRSGVGTLGPGPSGGGAGGAPGDEDSSSGCSNTDSGRGASEDGEQRARTPNKDEGSYEGNLTPIRFFSISNSPKKSEFSGNLTWNCSDILLCVLHLLTSVKATIG